MAGYARVSTDHEEQQTSYEAQVDYYTNYIKGCEDWEFVTVYTDEEISATSTTKRSGFNKMVADALDDRIDLVYFYRIITAVSSLTPLSMRQNQKVCQNQNV